MFANDLSKGYGENIGMKFRYFTAKGLGKIAIKDEGEYNSDVNSLLFRSDYIFTKYNKKNMQASVSKEKQREQYAESDTNLPSVDLSKIYTFLSLWKNETGSKDNRNYSSDGIKVEYTDIYKTQKENGEICETKTKVGDIFESAPEVFFQLLEASDNTRDLVDVYKYIMYLYTGIDYGITDASQLAAILQTQGIYLGSSFIVKTTEENAAPVLTRQQLEKVINTYSGATKTNLLSALDGFMYIQDTYKVNAVFAIAVARTESSGGTNWGRISSTTKNWMSVQGSYNGNSWTGSDGQKWRQYDSFNTATQDFGNLISGSLYFGNGRYDVASIGQRYCPPGDSWASTVTSIMIEIYNKAGVDAQLISLGGATGGIEGVTGGNVTTFTVGGRTYKNYKQGDYKVPLANFPGYTIANSGCAITSVAIIANGFGKNITPIDVNNQYKIFGSANHPRGLQYYTGVKCSYQTTNVKNGIIDQLRRGYPVLVYVTKNSNRFATSRQHFFTILSISEDGSMIYVSDPGSRRQSRNGWIPTSVLNGKEFNKFIKME